MKGLNKLALCTAIAASSMSVNAELTALNDSALGELTGQAGVSLDVNLALSIEEFRYIDTDGANYSSAATGAALGVQDDTRGSVSFSGIAIGQIDNFAAQGRDALDADLTTDAAVSIEGITIDVSAAGGVRIGLGNIGSANNGIDIRSDISINQAPGATTGNVGEFYISNLTNQVSSNLVDSLVASTGVALSTGVATLLATSPYIPVFVEIQGGGADGDQGLTINAEVGLIIDEIAYVDDGNAIGVRNLIVGDITWDPTDNNTIANLGGLRIDGLTVDVIDDNGTTKLAIGNINVTGDILLGDIFLSSRDATTGLSAATDATTGLTQSGNSLGSVLIRNLDTTGTSVLVYAHD